MIKPDYGFHERKLSNVFVLGVAANAGAIITRDTTDTSVIGVGDCSYGRVTTGSVTVAGDREMGHLYYDETTSGPSFFETVSGVLDLSTAVGTPCALFHSGPGDILSTDAFATTGTGAMVVGQASGNTSADSLLGVIGGKYVLVQSSGAGSVVRAKLIGNAVVNNVQCIRVQVL